jgi:precorrin-6A/cobalt-precorrin-6A reductase
MRVLILGGTTEGLGLAKALARDNRFTLIYSLAGRTEKPLLPDAAFRIGGFGGVDGLVQWITRERVDAVVDATHPFAARMSANAVAAADKLRMPLLRLQRLAWARVAGDDWVDVADNDAAVAALGTMPCRVFLTIGRKEVAAYRGAPQHCYVIRAVDPPLPDALPTQADVILQRGPFALDDELALLRTHGIDVVVSKNAGGDAAYAKVIAARQLGLPMVMIARPQLQPARECSDVDTALGWLDRLHVAHGQEPSERGV